MHTTLPIPFIKQNYNETFDMHECTNIVNIKKDFIMNIYEIYGWEC